MNYNTSNGFSQDTSNFDIDSAAHDVPNSVVSPNCSTSNTFTRSGKNNPCPVCDRTKDGDCRLSQDLILCHTYEDAKVGDLIKGYRCVKANSGHTATFAPDNRGQYSKVENNIHLTHTDREISKAEKKELAEKKKLEDARILELRISRELPLEDRHTAYILWLDSLSLSEKHRNELLVRGFSLEEIERLKYKTV